MKKKHVNLFFCIVMLALVTACGAGQNVSGDVAGNLPTAGENASVATTAPTPEVTSDEVGKQTEPTKAPQVTEAPEATKAPTSPKDVKVSLAEGDVTYKMDELTFVKAPRTEYTIQADGSVDVRFKQLDYAEIRFLFPERIDLNECSGITVRMRADYDVECMLLDKSIMWNKDCPAFYEEYAYAEGNIKEYYLTPNKVDEVYGIGFGPTQEVDDFSLYKATVYSVTFHAKRAEDRPEETMTPGESPKVTEAVKPTPTPVPSYPRADVSKGDICYTISELNIAGTHGVSYVTESEQDVTLKYEEQFSMIQWRLPEAIATEECTGITVKMKTDEAPAWCGIYLYGESFLKHPGNDEAIQYVHYAQTKDGLEAYGFAPPALDDIFGIGLMVTEDNIADYELIVESVTFHMLSGNSKSVPKEIAPDVTESMTLRNTYGTVIDKIGVSVTLSELRNPAILETLKEQYNSITSGLEAKPEAIWNNAAAFVSVEEAKKRGYVVPDTYKEAKVPVFNFEVLDEILKICAENGFSYRFHTLIWHEATSDWFFREEYSVIGEYVSKEVMDARMELYIRTVMEHVYGGPHGYIVYAWDVVNEHLHADVSCSNWMKIYGEERLEPVYVKNAYRVADDVLRKYGIRDKVSLVYNDYEAYLTIAGRDMSKDILAVLDYVNAEKRICDTIGLQTHMDTDIPIAGRQKKAILAFLDAGYKVQFTEAEVNIKIPETGKADQEKYYCEFMKTILEIAQNGGAITGLTFWGSSDVVSWLREYTPLLFSCSGRSKDVYYMVLQTYLDPDYTVVKEPVALTYEIGELQYLIAYVADYSVNKDGAVEVRFGDQYQEIKFLLPEAVDMKNCIGVTVRMQSEYDAVAVKLYGEEVIEEPYCSDLFTSWGWQGKGMQDYDSIPQCKDAVYGLGFMSMNTVDDYSKYTATVESITFYMTEPMTKN